jgi:hypothetical protein
MNHKIVTAAIVSAGVAIATALILRLYFARKGKKDENFEEVELLDFESTGLMLMVPSVSTVTFYEGNVEYAQNYISDRLTQVVMLNRWLEGRLERGSNNKLYLRYSQQKHDN